MWQESFGLLRKRLSIGDLFVLYLFFLRAIFCGNYRGGRCMIPRHKHVSIVCEGAQGGQMKRGL
jgi:hypothetical protein